MQDLRRIKAKEVPDLKKNILVKQGWKCPLCDVDMRKLPPRNWCLDHNHATGAIRGVLCRNCNGLEGKILSRVVRAARGKSVLDWLSRLWHYYNTHEINQHNLLHNTYKTPMEKRALANKRAKKRYADAKKKKIAVAKKLHARKGK